MTDFDLWAGSLFPLEEFGSIIRPGISSVTAMALSMEKEKCRKDEERRTKQISYGYATKEYQYYIKTVAKKDRKKGDPLTPDKNGADMVSRRRWDGRVKNWRRALHRWYDTHSHPSTTAESSTSSVSGLRSETGMSDKAPVSLPSPVDCEALLNELSLEEKLTIPHGKPIPVLASSSSFSSAKTSDFHSSEIYAGIYYQMMVQQNLVLTWLFQNTTNPQFPTVCELLQQFFTQQAAILNCLAQNYGS